jgi:outer membrane protein assembly factor BamB
MVSTPTLYKDVLYFGSFNNRLYALSIENRDILWTYDTTNWVWSSPVIDEQDELLISADLDGHVFALNLNDGSVAWTYEATGPVVGAPQPGELDDGTSVVYITSGGDPNLIVLKTSDGTEAIRSATLQAEFTTNFLIIPTGTDTRPIPIFAPPTRTDDLVLIGAHQGNDTLYVLDGDDLKEQGRFNPTTYEKELQEQRQEQTGEQPESFLTSPWMSALMMFTVVLLMLNLLRRGRPQK